MTGWVEFCRVGEVPRLGARVACTLQGPVAVFRTRDDQIFALEDRCPHRGGPLSQGIVHGQRVTCPLHEWMIELETGVAVAPDEGTVTAYPVRVENGVIFVRLAPVPAEVTEDMRTPMVAEAGKR